MLKQQRTALMYILAGAILVVVGAAYLVQHRGSTTPAATPHATGTTGATTLANPPPAAPKEQATSARYVEAYADVSTGTVTQIATAAGDATMGTAAQATDPHAPQYTTLRFIPVEGCPQEFYDPTFAITGPTILAGQLAFCRNYLTDGRSVYFLANGWTQLVSEVPADQLTWLPADPATFTPLSKTDDLTYNVAGLQPDMFAHDDSTLFMNDHVVEGIDAAHMRIPGGQTIMDDRMVYVQGVRYPDDVDLASFHVIRLASQKSGTLARDRYGVFMNGVRFMGSRTDPLYPLPCDYVRDSKMIAKKLPDNTYRVLAADIDTFTIEFPCTLRDKYGSFFGPTGDRLEDVNFSSGEIPPPFQ